MSFLGLDVGGSKCRFEWWPRGSAPGGDAPTSQPAVDGVDAASAALAVAIERAVAAHRRPEAVVCAVAGGGDAAIAAAIATSLRARTGIPVAVVGDVLAAAAAGLREGPGLLLWSGTGSFAVARGPDGRLARVGGRGYAFGDEGSGYDLVRRAIVAVLRAVDGRGRTTALTDALTRAFDAPSPERLGAVAQRLSPGEVAARLPVVLDAFEQDDWLAADVLMVGMRQLVELGEAALRRVQLPPSEGQHVALGGGVMHSDLLRDGLVRVMQAAFGHEVDAHRVGPDDAAVGAAWLAAGWHAGQRPQQQWVDDVAL
ncbi:MAG: N-acetylglucosamine kinase [Planctomycetota bacterium]